MQQNFKLVLRLTIALTLLSLVVPQTAFAYLDPGSGSYILQVLIGVLAGVLLAVKIFWGRIKTFFSNSLAKSRKAERDND